MDQAYLKERLSYDPATGVFTWLENDKAPVWWRRKYEGQPAGCVDVKKNGYTRIRIGIDGTLYKAHQLAWLYMTGEWPTNEIDHIDHDTTHNAWANLREVDHEENGKNQSKKKNNTSGATGVSWNMKSGKWLACIGVGKRQVRGGLFKDFADAVARRKELEIEYGFHANHGV